MKEDWRMFPASMGDDQAFISFDNAFAQHAAEDQRHCHVRAEVTIKNPTEAGLPQGVEFKALSALDDALEAAIRAVGGVYVGRITVAARRFFYFYVDATEAEARAALEPAARHCGYVVTVKWELDPARCRYWQELYPTADDLRVINDMQVLDALAEAGDAADATRPVQHWAYFGTEDAAVALREWLKDAGYEFWSLEHEAQGGRYKVTFTHHGSMHLGSVTDYTLRARRRIEDELGGEYDGWETQVVSNPP
jgi:hypothetical protein